MSHPRQISFIAGRRTISIPIEGLARGGEVEMAKRLSSSQGRHLIYPENNSSSNRDWVSAGWLRWRAATARVSGRPEAAAAITAIFNSRINDCYWRRVVPKEPVEAESPSGAPVRFCLCAEETDGVRVYRGRLWFEGVRTDRGENSAGQVLNLRDGWCSSHNCPDLPASLLVPITGDLTLFKCL